MAKVRIFKEKLKSGKLCRFYSYDFTINGQRYCKSTGITRKADAQAYTDDLYDRIRLANVADSTIQYVNRKITGKKSIPLDKAVYIYLNKPSKKKRSEGRVQDIISRWEDLLAYLKKHAPGVKDMGQLKTSHAEDYISMLQTTGRFLDPNKTMLAVATTNKFIKDLRSIFNRLRNDAGLTVNPFDEEFTPLQTADVVARDAFEIEELQLVGEKANMFVYHMFMIGMNTGFREGDICTLRWREVDFKNNIINRVMLKTGKEVHPPILSHLRAYLERIYPYTGHQEYVSPIHAEIYLPHPTTISARVRVELSRLKIQTQIKVANRTRMQSIKNVHSLRHAFCYYAMVEGVELPIVQSIVGHVDKQMTLMYANHASQKIIQERVKRIPDYLNPNEVRGIEGADYTRDHCYSRKIQER